MPVAVLCAALLVTAAHAGPGVPADPLASPQWPAMQQRFFRDAAVVFDDLVEVTLPPAAEDSMQVPVSARVRSGTAVDTLIAFIDFNPIPKVL
ncbi:MAG TPA: thiosulfate oxidation carrier protein SoxY, partial [Plasticicumulans sp.]|nr:thiosulfate oxidation carrier protein SoxY [Plasticicumulans sp.]